VYHNLSETTGVSFLESDLPTEETHKVEDEPLMSVLWKRYTYRSRHLRLGILGKFAVVVGGLWLVANT